MIQDQWWHLNREDQRAIELQSLSVFPYLNDRSRSRTF